MSESHNNSPKRNKASLGPLNHIDPDKRFEEKPNKNYKVRSNRLNLQVPIYIKSSEGHLVQGYAESINISFSGILIESNIPLNPNDLITLELTLPKQDHCLSIDAKVVRIDGSLDSEYPHIGLIFTSSSNEHKDILNAYILEHLN